MGFDKEKARDLLRWMLETKRREAEDNKNEERIKNIDEILKSEELFEKLLDIALLSDISGILNAVENAKYKDNGKISGISNNILWATVGRENLQIEAGGIFNYYGYKNRIQDLESLRKYLYEEIGFEFQTHKEAKAAKEKGEGIIDPLAIHEEVTYGALPPIPTVFMLIDNIEKLRQIQGPQHTETSQARKR